VLVLDVREGRPSVPERALVSARTGYSVFVIRDGKAVRRKVKIGLRRPGVVEILEGVETGEQVVVGGQMRLSDGAGVVIKKGEGGAGGEKQ
jgi:membrane fusion protein (multidrug efflux system)